MVSRLTPACPWCFDMELVEARWSVRYCVMIVPQLAAIDGMDVASSTALFRQAAP